MNINYDSSVNRWFIYFEGKLVWFDGYDQAEDWIKLNQLGDSHGRQKTETS